MAQLKCIVVTPEATVLEQDTSFVVVPMADGELGIAGGHSPMIGRLGYGEMRLQSATGETSQYYVDGGFVQVAKDVVSVLTSRATPANDIDTGVAQEQLDASIKEKATSAETRERRDRGILRARAQLRVARRAGQR